MGDMMQEEFRPITETEIKSAKAAYLANGGKITKLDGFGEIKHLPRATEPSRPAPRKRRIQIATVDAFVGCAYIAEGVGLGIKHVFHSGLFDHMLPMRRQMGRAVGFTKTDADRAIEAIKEHRRKNEPDPNLHVDRHYICDALGVTPSGLFNSRNSHANALPEPAFIQRGRGRPKLWYLKAEVDVAIEKIRRLRNARSAAFKTTVTDCRNLTEN